MNLSNNLRKVNFFLTLATFVLTPILFLPITSEFYEFNKFIFLIIVAGISLILWTATFVLDKQVRITRSPIGLPIVLILISWLVSAFLRSPNLFDALFEPGQAGTIATLAIIFFAGINSVHTRKHLETLFNAFQLSISLLAGVTILWSSGLMPAILPQSFLKLATWTPTGNTFGTFVVLSTATIFWAIYLFKQRFQASKPRIVLSLLTLVVSFIGAGLIGYQLFVSNANNRPAFLNQGISWTIAMEALKVSPLFGTGPSTYLADFTRFRPVGSNLSDAWAVRFSSPSNYYALLLSTIGLFGLLSYLLLVAKSFVLFSKSLKTTSDSPLHYLAVASSTTVLLAFIAQLFIPTSLVFLVMIVFLLILSVSAHKHLGSSLVSEANIDIVAASDNGSHSPLLPWISAVLAIVLVVPSFYYTGRLYVAEILYQKALTFAAANDGKQTYDTLINAIRVFPYRDAYRVTYSQTNLLLANSIAGSKKDLSEQERNTVSQLIQQSIREAKNAVALNPSRVNNVESLAIIYRTLIPLAKGADAWTISSYRQAITLDPVNPNLRIALGGVQFGLKNYDEAIKNFTDAINLKPNLANAYYNLSAAYKAKGDYTKALAAMQAVVTYIDKDSADYTKAVQEAAELKTKVGETKTSAVEPAKTQLEAPKALPTPKITPIELPSELGPEATTTPSPKPTVVVTPTPAQ